MGLTNFPNGINAGTLVVGDGTPIGGFFVHQTTLSPTVLAANTSAEQTFAVAGVVANDVLLSINKPTAQAGIGIVGQRVVSDGTVGITFANFTAGTIVPTASQVYDIVTLKAP